MIRKTTREDRQQVIELAKLFIDDIEEMKFSERAAIAHFDLFIGTEGIISLVVEEDGKVVGFIAGIISAKYFCEGKSCQELVWFVHPDHRSGGVRLHREFEKKAAGYNCDDIIMASFLGTKVDDYYMRSGYKQVNSIYLKKVG